MPEPLSHMLEPEEVPSAEAPLSRHKSVQGDPGVIGPIVWDLHCHRVNKQSKSGKNRIEDDIKVLRNDGGKTPIPQALTSTVTAPLV